MRRKEGTIENVTPPSRPPHAGAWDRNSDIHMSMRSRQSPVTATPSRELQYSTCVPGLVQGWQPFPTSQQAAL